MAYTGPVHVEGGFLVRGKAPAPVAKSVRAARGWMIVVA
jgi:hypothetical protein